MECLGLGGAEQSLLYVLPELRRRGHLVEVAALYPPYDLAPRLESAGIAVHRLSLHHRWSLLEGTMKLGAMLRQRQYDVAHAKLFFASTYLSLTRDMAPAVARVVSFHNLAYESYPAASRLKRLRKRLDAELMARCIDGFAALSPAVANHYEEHLGVGPIEIIPNAVPIDEMRALPLIDRAAVRAFYGLREDAFVIAMVARLVHEKGHRYMIDAVAQLPDDSNTQLLIAGKGPERKRIRAQVERLELGPRVVLRTDGVSHDEALRLFKASDLAAVPSTHEAFGLAPAEAMALGVPVLASRVGGLPYLLEHGRSGWLVEPRSSQALRAAIIELQASPNLLSQLATQGRLRVEEKFTVPTVAGLWEALYQRCIASHQASARSRPFSSSVPT